MNALDPYISEDTLRFHYGKHHQAYVNNLNNLVRATSMEKMKLEELIKLAAAENKIAIFNNAAQAWNHTFYWESMRPNGGGKELPKGPFLDQVKKDFGSEEKMLKDFAEAASTFFGCGWVWIVFDKKKKCLAVVTTRDADVPFLYDQVPLLVLDVWEHAYYLDCQNRRDTYINVFLSFLVNWDIVSDRYNNME